MRLVPEKLLRLSILAQDPLLQIGNNCWLKLVNDEGFFEIDKSSIFQLTFNATERLLVINSLFSVFF